MNSIPLTESQTKSLHLSNNSRPVKSGAPNYFTCGAIIGLGCGTILPTVGALLLVADWFITNAGLANSLHKVGTVLLLTTIPLLFFGGYCLDLAEGKSKQKNMSEGE